MELEVRRPRYTWSEWWMNFHPVVLCYLGAFFWGALISYATSSAWPLIGISVFYWALAVLPTLAFTRHTVHEAQHTTPLAQPHDALIRRLDTELSVWENELEELGRQALEDKHGARG